MSGATKMYALKPIMSPSNEITVPKTMFSMKNIHEVREPIVTCRRAYQTTNVVSNITEQDPLPEVAQLEIRQEKILAQLAQLKVQVSTLCGILKNPDQSRPRVSRNLGQVQTSFVVNANPAEPPYSILALRKILRDTDFKIASYVHSSINEKPADFLIASENRNDNHNEVDITLIWKEAKNLEVIISGLRGTPLLGEVNLLRYLSRLLPGHNYEEDSDATSIDAVLDISHELSIHSSSKEVRASLVALSAKLGKGEWMLARREASIADVAAWSSIKRLESKNLPTGLSSWFERCDKAFREN